MSIAVALVSAIAALNAVASPSEGSITVDAAKPGRPISPMLYGLFFEEINCAGDGGLYAELVRNGSFEDSAQPDHWKPVGDAKIAVDESEPISERNRRSLLVKVPGAGGVENEGYYGIGLSKGQSYKAAFSARADAGPLGVTIQLFEGDVAVSTPAQVSVSGSGWRPYAAKLTATANTGKAKLRIVVDRPGALRIDGVSLFPAKTWNGRPNGLRTDLARMLADIGPSFVRFPGGCWVEGDTMATAQRWKQTIGPVFERRTQPNLWGYQSGNGLGFHEYLQMCEDLGAEPLFVFNCGMSHREVVSLDKMDEFVQDALDAVEYANGPADTRWGALRAKNGHPKPFGLRYMEIGNENGGQAYNERYALFYKAIKTRYPEMNLVADQWGGLPTGTPVEIVDEHYYNSPQFFMDNADRYDSYDRKGPKVYVGEYAVTQGCGGGNLIAAIGEAAFMTGMERNSDVVAMASYAPLFANVNHKTWNPDLINFDSTRAYGIPSYYVQRMFSRNRGDVVLPIQLSVQPPKAQEFEPGGIAVGTWATQAEFKEVKVTQGQTVLFESADGSALQPVGGIWETVRGARRQTSNEDGALASAGDATWHDYALTLKARKIGGAEGFLIAVGRRDDRNWIWWNVGGWGNSRTALEMSNGGAKREWGRGAPGGIETGRWYDVKVVYSADRIACYLDGKLVQDAAYPASKRVFATASRDSKTGEVIVKVVNASAKAITLSMALKGLPDGCSVVGRAETLSGGPADENSLEQPEKVKPVSGKVAFRGPEFTYGFPAYSVTILRLKAKA